jgi:hypothetical protein
VNSGELTLSTPHFPNLEFSRGHPVKIVTAKSIAQFAPKSFAISINYHVRVSTKCNLVSTKEFCFLFSMTGYSLAELYRRNTAFVFLHEIMSNSRFSQLNSAFNQSPKDFESTQCKNVITTMI